MYFFNEDNKSAMKGIYRVGLNAPLDPGGDNGKSNDCLLVLKG